jgi:hypothetical protein
MVRTRLHVRCLLKHLRRRMQGVGPRGGLRVPVRRTVVQNQPLLGRLPLIPGVHTRGLGVLLRQLPDPRRRRRGLPPWGQLQKEVPPALPWEERSLPNSNSSSSRDWCPRGPPGLPPPRWPQCLAAARRREAGLRSLGLPQDRVLNNRRLSPWHLATMAPKEWQ